MKALLVPDIQLQAVRLSEPKLGPMNTKRNPHSPPRWGSWAVWAQWSQLLPRSLQGLCMCSFSLSCLLARREKNWLHPCLPTCTSWTLKDFLKASKAWKKKKKEVIKNHWVSFKFIGTADGKDSVNFLFILLTLTSKLLCLFPPPWHDPSWCAWEVEALLLAPKYTQVWVALCHGPAV